MARAVEEKEDKERWTPPQQQKEEIKERGKDGVDLDERGTGSRNGRVEVTILS